MEKQKNFSEWHHREGHLELFWVIIGECLLFLEMVVRDTFLGEKKMGHQGLTELPMW